ncbi:MAG: signal recognition particle protein [Phycisphaerales bacterium]|nr:signal recognition particle protein [Phycisphaerales bacterium]
MFETLTDRLNTTFRSLSGRGRISEDNIKEAMREVRSSLLEADVNLDVVTQFCDEVTKEALGAEVLKSLKPDEQMIGIVHAKLVELMGPVDSQLMMVDPPPTIVMMCGLQGTGKTTTCGKLAAWLKKRGKRVLVVAADLQRPAAVEQLRQVVEESVAEAPGDGHVAFHGEPDKCAEYGKATGVAVMVCQRALKRARAERFDVLLLDTAGRLHVDEDLMKEIQAIDHAVQPHQRMLVVDAMTGQDAVNSAREFNERLAIDGVILTKFDSDTRGGAALSVKRVTGAPIKFIGVGEKVTALEEFHAERMAGRILGMGDVVSLVEKAHEEVEEEEAEKLAEKMAKGQFSLNDFTKQLRTMRRMGPLKQLLGMLPGVGGALKDLDIDDKQLDRLEGIVNSMTQREREDTAVLSKSRTKRIANGAGVPTTEVNKLVKQFGAMQKVTKQMAGMGAMGKMKAMRQMQSAGAGAAAGMGGGMPGFGSRGSTKTKSVKSGFKRRKRR